MSEPFNKLHHVCIVVHDLEKTAAYYESIGIGPFQDYPPLTEYTEVEVPNPEAFRRLIFKVANLDNMQIQLCQPSELDSPQRHFLDTHGEGVFHMGFIVPRVDVAEEEAKAKGMKVLMRGRRPDRSGFTYFDTPDQAGGVVLLCRSNPPVGEAKS